MQNLWTGSEEATVPQPGGLHESVLMNESLLGLALSGGVPRLPSIVV
jgi:hypothetical protein